MAAPGRDLRLPACLLLLLTLLLSAPADGEASPRPVVRTRQGAVRGTTRQANTGRQFLAFYNLPFARPPVGELRFREPQPADSWVHVRDASQPGQFCTQNNMFNPSQRPVGTEDCLYLNVFTPKSKSRKLLPVMVWYHGGGFVSGGATWYEPDFIMEHDVILVTTNYRLGILGFLSTGDASAPGNFAFKDQVAALRWVKENIEAFGGDPGSVTIFGHSAGGGSVHFLMLSPLAKGLFHRAIVQSGVALAPWAAPGTDPLVEARRAAAHLGCPTEPSAALVDCLRTKDDHDVTAAETLFTDSYGILELAFKPAVEEESEHAFLTKNPLDLQPHSAVPWIVGVTQDEGLLTAAVFTGNKSAYAQFVAESDRQLPIAFMYNNAPDPNLITKRIKEFYFPSGGLPFDKLTEVASDAFFTWSTDESIRQYKDRAPVYYYVFAYRGKYRMMRILDGGDEHIGVSHGDDLYYLFSNTSYFPTTPDRPEKDMETIKTMTKLWTQFAKTGNPTPSDDPVHWPRVTSDDELEYLEIGQELKVKRGAFQERINFWRSLPLRNTGGTNSIKEEF